MTRTGKARVRSLTAAERIVTDLAARGYTNEQIALRLSISLSAVKQRMERALDVAQVDSRVELAAWVACRDAGLDFVMWRARV